MAHRFRHLFDSGSSEYQDCDANRRVNEIVEITKMRKLEEELNDFKDWYSDRKDILKNIASTFYDLIVEITARTKQISKNDAVIFLRKNIRLDFDSMDEYVLRLNKDNEYVWVHNPHKMTEQQIIEIFKDLVFQSNL